MTQLLLEDRLPPGTFFADLTAEQIRAIQLVEAIGTRLEIERPEMADMYREGRSYLEIAFHYIPFDAEHFPGVAQKAVGYAIRKLIPSNEQAELTRKHRGSVLEDNVGGYDSPEFITQCKSAAKRRHELHGVDTDAMIKGRGRTPWTDIEKAYVTALSQNPLFQHRKGSIAGTPNYVLITEMVNNLFHDGQPIRYTNSVASFVRDTRR